MGKKPYVLDGTTPYWQVRNAAARVIGRVLTPNADWEATLPPHPKNRPEVCLLHAIVNDDKILFHQALDAGADFQAKWLAKSSEYLSFPIYHTMLHHAIGRGRVHMVAELAERGALKGPRDAWVDPLRWAVITRVPPAMLALLAQFGEDIEARDAKGEPLLSLAVTMSAFEQVSELVRLGADPYAMDAKGRNLFHALLFSPCNSDKSQLVGLLLDCGVDAMALETLEWKALGTTNLSDCIVLKDIPCHVAPDDCQNFSEHYEMTHRLALIAQQQEKTNDTLRCFLAVPPRDRAQRYVTGQGTPTPELNRLCAFGHVPEILDGKHWHGAPEAAAAVHRALPPYYHQKHPHLDLLYLRAEEVGTQWRQRTKPPPEGLGEAKRR